MNRFRGVVGYHVSLTWRSELPGSVSHTQGLQFEPGRNHRFCTIFYVHSSEPRQTPSVRVCVPNSPSVLRSFNDLIRSQLWAASRSRIAHLLLTTRTRLVLRSPMGFTRKPQTITLLQPASVTPETGSSLQHICSCTCRTRKDIAGSTREG